MSLIGLGLLAGNIIRSWQTDENFDEAEAKNRKANRIVQEAVAELENATKSADEEQNKLREIKKKAYDTLLEFVEVFNQINDVRFHESNIGKENLVQISPDTISMLKEFHYEPTIVDTTTVGDAAGMLSLLLPVGIGSFGSFSSLRESKAALAEAEANVYEARSVAREIESGILVVEATRERAKLLSDALSGLYKNWFLKATQEFKRLVESKNAIKYYFLSRDGQSVYTDEEYAFIAALAALSKTVKILIDAKLFDEEERESEVLSDNPEVKKLTSNVNKQIQTDNSFGLKKTYCAALIQGKVNDTELVRPSDCFVDDYAATKAKLAEEGYESICIFEDYVKNTKTADSESVKEQYLQICEELYMEEQYRQLATKIINEEKAGKKFGYQALCVLKETLEQWSGTYSEKAKLVLYLEEKIHESIGKNGKPKYGQRGFAGLKKWVHICLFETEGRRKERIAQLGEVISWNALEAGYNNRAFAKLPTATFYEDRLRKAKPLDCAIATFFTAVIIFLLQEFHLITWINVALPVCLWLLFIVCNRREKGLLRMIQLSACYATAGLGGIVFYCNAEKWIAHENFLVINGLTLVLTIVVLLFIKEKKCFRNIFLSRVIWMVPITCYMLFTLMALEWFTDIKYGLVLITCCQMVILLISLYGLNKSENMRFNRKSFTNEKTLMGISAMLILVGAVVLVLSEELMSVAGIGSIMLLIFSAIASFLVGALTTNSEKNIIKAIGLAFMISTGYLVCLMLHGFLHYLLPLGKILSLVISEIIYLIMTVILCMAVVIDETTSSEINTKI